MKAELLLNVIPPTHARSRRGRGFSRLWQFATEYLLALPLGALIALVWANTNAEGYYRLAHATAFFVNDVLMVAFFGLITKEIVEATAPGGVLHPWRRAALPVLASWESPSSPCSCSRSWCASSTNRCSCAVGRRCWPWIWRSATSSPGSSLASTPRFPSSSSSPSARMASDLSRWPLPTRSKRFGLAWP